MLNPQGRTMLQFHFHQGRPFLIGCFGYLASFPIHADCVHITSIHELFRVYLIQDRIFLQFQPMSFQTHFPYFSSLNRDFEVRGLLNMESYHCFYYCVFRCHCFSCSCLLLLFFCISCHLFWYFLTFIQ